MAIVRNEHNFSLQLLDTDGKLHLLSREEVRDIRIRKAIADAVGLRQDAKRDGTAGSARVSEQAGQPADRRGRRAPEAQMKRALVALS